MTFTEELFFKIRRFVDKYGDEFASVEEAAEAFMQAEKESNDKENISLLEIDKAKAKEVHFEAKYAETIEEYAAIIDYAHSLDPTNLDIQRDFILLAYKEPEAYEMLEHLAEQYYFNNQAILEQLAYLIASNRPYFRLKYALAEHFKKQFIFDKAEQHAMDILKLDENDSLGVRYLLMAIYILSHQHEKVKDLYQDHENNKDDDIMVFYMLISAVLSGQDDYAYQLTERLLELNDDLILVFKNYEFISYYKYSIQEPYYSPGTEESLNTVISELLIVFENSNYLYNKIRQNIIDLVPDATFTSEPYFNFHEFRKENQARIVAKQEIFEDISLQYVKIFMAEGINTKKDMEKYTKDEILALQGIGNKTVEKLINNGVVFKS